MKPHIPGAAPFAGPRMSPSRNNLTLTPKSCRNNNSVPMDAEESADMPVSVMYFMELLGATIPADFLDKLDALFDSQDQLVASYAETHKVPPSLTSHRGLALYQQIEDPKVIVGSGQWPSSAVCQEWFTSEAGLEFAAGVESYHNPSAMDITVMEGFIFTDATSPGGSPPMLDAPHLEITRWRVPADRKDQFQAAAEALQRQKTERDPYSSVFHSWRLDEWPPRPDSDAVKEHFMIASCAEVDRESLGGQASDLSKEEVACKGLAVSTERRHYTKAL